MCLICDRIKMIQNGTNPYFVKELETGYVVIGDNQLADMKRRLLEELERLI
ncbi:MAG: hypothetical protein IJ746_07615 [Ruminococcus sp.]|nr:hypothetical protein [Ruminococcus sp.]